MRPDSLVIEILNHRTFCDYYGNLFAGCRIAIRRLFCQYGNRYQSHLHGYVYIYIYTYTYTHICTHTYTHMHAYVCIHKLFVRCLIAIRRLFYQYGNRYQSHLHGYEYIYKYLLIYIHTYTHIYTYTRTHTHIHMHTYIHLYIHYLWGAASRFVASFISPEIVIDLTYICM